MDIDNQSAGNYGYDEIGNLKKDVSENIDTVRWTVYGKINRIVKSSGSTVINYGYDAGGNRTTKVVSGSADTTTYYIRDAQGNVLAVYTKKGTDSLQWNEQHLYGSSRLGMWLPDSLPTSPPIVMDSTAIQDSLMIGSRTYELTNHLGNVLSTISDKKIGNDSSGTVNYYIAEVLSQNDYYPFGMLEPGRQYSISNYRYGFNGKEQDPETYGQGNIYDYGFRIYNPRLGRFLSVDPLTSSFPWYSPYLFAGNKPLFAIDLDGFEEKPVITEKFIEDARKRISQNDQNVKVAVEQGQRVIMRITFGYGPDNKDVKEIVYNEGTIASDIGFIDMNTNGISYQWSFHYLQPEPLIRITEPVEVLEKFPYDGIPGIKTRQAPNVTLIPKRGAGGYDQEKKKNPEPKGASKITKGPQIVIQNKVSEIQFEHDSRHIVDDPTTEINEIVSMVKAEGVSDYSITIFGNYGSGDDNADWSNSNFYIKYMTIYKNYGDVAMARANKIKDLLIKRGLDPSKIKTTLGNPNKPQSADYKITTTKIE